MRATKSFICHAVTLALVGGLTALAGCRRPTPAPGAPTPVTPSPTEPAATLTTPEPTEAEPTPTPTVSRAATADAVDVSNLPLHLPAPPVHNVIHEPRIEAIQTKLRQYPTFAAYEQLARIYVEHHHYDEAAAALRTESAMYRAKHLVDAAIIKENQAASYETDVRLYVDRPVTPTEMPDCLLARRWSRFTAATSARSSTMTIT